jgi:hypothetical protein
MIENSLDRTLEAERPRLPVTLPGVLALRALGAVVSAERFSPGSFD